MSNIKYDVVFSADDHSTMEAMPCPQCTYPFSKVTTTRPGRKGTFVGKGRERKCLQCEHVFRTLELGPMVLERLK